MLGAGPNGQGGFLLSLVTESFAVRALLGSLAALALASCTVRLGLVRSSRARRLLILAPVLTAALAGTASISDAEAYLPQLWVTTAAATGGAAGQLLDLLGDLRVIDHRRMDVLVVAYLLVVSILLLRRVAGVVRVRHLLRRARPPVAHGYLMPIVHRYAVKLGVPIPQLVLLDACPGGAFTAGVLRPVVAVDPHLLHQLDAAEIEGLLAHELAHIKRRDALLGQVVGAFRDLTFFLPPLHLAARWLRREQEESADELASTHTGRPAALASGILKVWDCSRASRGISVACAAVPVRRAAFAGIGGRVPDAQGLSLRGAAKSISVRVERLISRAPVVSPWRRRAETALATGILVVATTAALAVPSWIVATHNTDMLAFAYLTAQPPGLVESPAFATFRALAPSVGAGAARERVSSISPDAVALVASSDRGGVPRVESQAQLREAVPATTLSVPAYMLWRSEGQRSWELDPIRRQATVHAARPLLTLSDSGPQVGFFLVGRAS